MAILPVNKIVEGGLDVVGLLLAASAGGDTVVNPEHDVFLYAKNTNAATRTITVTAQKTQANVKGFGTLTRSNVAVTVPVTTGERMIGPFPEAFNKSDGTGLQITYDATAGLTVGAFQLPRTP